MTPCPAPSVSVHAAPDTPDTSAAPGALYLAPAPLDFGCDGHWVPVTDVLPHATLCHMARIGYWVCENAKTLRALLKRVDAVVPLAQPVQQLHVAQLPRAIHKKGDHAGSATAQSAQHIARQLLAPALQGHDMALASEAGLPAVADPGSSLVRAAQHMGLRVVPLTGPNSLLLALSASGLNGQHFAFEGYLPQDATARGQRLRALEHTSTRTGQTHIWIETPYRNQALYAQALHLLQPTTMLCVAEGLTLADMRITTRNIAAHRKNPLVFTDKRPAVFLMGV